MTEDSHKSIGGTSQTDYSCSQALIQNTHGNVIINLEDHASFIVNVNPTGTPGSNGKSSSQDISFKKDYDKYVKRFLDKVRLHMDKKMKWDKNKHFESHPTKIVVDMESVRQTDWKTVMRGDSDTLYGRDVGKVDVTQIHDPIRDNGKKPIHVMILGSAGAGKSTIASDYTLSVRNGDVEALKNIQLVYYVSTTTLQYDGQSKAFDLFFTDLMVHDKDTELTINEQKAGEDWVKNNSSKILLTIDGLDQCAREFGGKHVYSARSDNSPTTANDIIANVMSRNIWPGIQILTTARWNIYWNLRDDQRPDKVIGLRGFDDDNMIKAMLHLEATKDDAIMMVQQLPPKLLALCRNPVFLKYTVKIFNKNQSSLPNSVAGIISAFFRDFLHTCHRDDYEDLTKLAFNGMNDNIYIFLSNYLKRLGVKPGEINDFLSPGAILEEDYDVAIAADKFYTFSHQTMQEFCCALHVLNLSPIDIRNFVANKLNEEGMELTRQILYGLLLDATITNQMIGYLGQRRTSIEECRQILQEQLVIILRNGAIRDIPTLDLLSECGDDTIRQFERDIREIDINVSDLLREEQSLLISMIKQFPFLQQVSVAEFFLVESFPVKDLKECLPYTGSFKLKRLKITYDLMTENVPHDIADLLKETRCDALDYVKCDLTTQKLARMLDEYKKKDVKLTSINTWDETMSADVYRVIAKTYAVTGCDCVSFIDCDLTKRKLECFGLGCQENELSLRMVTIIDNSMTEDGYEELGNVLEASSCQELQFQRCHLSKSKLEQLLRTCQEKDHHISKLRIMDASMPADAYWVVAAILKATKCMEVIFLNCSLTREKVCNFKMGLEENEVFLSKISVKDATMPADVYCDFATILWKSQCRDVVFLHCNLTREKLSNFGSGLEEKKILLNFLTIIDDRMAEDGYEELATSPILKTCQELQLESCDLNTMKLNRLLTGLKNCGVHLTRLRIKDATMTADIYRHIATAYRDARCILVALLDCNLDRDKLDNFAMGFKQNKITLSRLHIHDALISEDDYGTIGAVLHASQCGTVAFYNCNLTMQKMHNFGNSLKENQVSLNLLLIEDKVMEENAYREIANTMPLVRGLQLKSCDLDKAKLNGLLEGCKKGKMPLSRLVIMDPSTPEDAYTEIAAILSVTQCRNLSFFLCNLTKNKISNFVMGCKEHQIFLSELCISDPSMPCEVYGDVAEILHATKCNISFESCNLMREKLAHFRMRLSSLMLQNTRQLKMLTIVDKLMAEGGYGELAKTLQQTHFKELMLKGCNLNEKKLAMLMDEWHTDENCRFPKLWICDTAMPGDAYGDVAALLCKTRCRNMAFLNCRLTKLKLSNMEMGCNELSVSLSELFIVDQFMAADLYYDIAAIVQAAHCDEVTFGNCNLTKEKLEAFGLGYKDRDASLSKLHIIDGKMPADVYRNIAATLKAAHCQKIILRECGMKKDKFKNLGIGFQDTKTSLEFLSIAGQSVAEVDYEELVRALKLSRCQDFEVGSRFLINISPNRLREEFEKQNFTLSQLRINGASAHPEMYDNVVAALCATGCDKVAFLNCYLTKERLLHFGKSLEGHRMRLSELMISDATMQADAHSIVASIPRHPLLSCIAFENCSLSMQKLKNLGTGFKKSEKPLSKLKIMDPKLLPAVYSDVAVFLNDARCSEVDLTRCHLTKEKLTSFGNGCKEKQIYLSALSVDDREMPTESYSEISNILHVTQCRNLDFTRCNLTKQKMSNFGMECAKNQVSLHQLTIHDSEMTNDVYEELANVLYMTKCEGLKLEKCEVNVAKLDRLLRGCRKKNIKLENVLINDELKICKDLYVTLARLLKQTRCSKLELENCDLSKEKLSGIGNEIQEHNFKLPELSIVDKRMSEDVYAYVVTAVQQTGCTKLSLRGCELDDEKLQRLGGEFFYQEVQLNSLCVSDKVMTEEGYAELVNLLNDTKCTKLHLECCALNEKKILQFCRKCKELNVKIAELVLTSEHSIGTEQIKSAVFDLKTHVIALKWFIIKNGKLSLEETSRPPYMDIGTSQ